MSEVHTAPDNPKFARFSRRVQGLMYDNMIVVVLIVATLSLAIAAEGVGGSRLVGFTGAAIILLYEPILVAFRGATIGHAARNMRVVDDRTQGNISFPKALARYVIKLVLGIFSFLTMATTQRHQAFHDLLTGSTVRIRDDSQAEAHHYQLARTEFSDGTMPSRLRRIAIILGYLAVSIFGSLVAVGLLLERVLTPECLNNDRLCTLAEELVLTAAGLGLLTLFAVIIVAGWRGKLPGARRSAAA
jgi:uncharacterized RDD family membrane protein YckC